MNLIKRPCPIAATDEAIIEIERRLGPLPGDYVEFIKQRNGGPVDSIDDVRAHCFHYLSVDSRRPRLACMQLFYSIGIGMNAPRPYYDALRAYDNMKSGIDGYPEYLLPIGETEGGGIIVMGMSPERKGEVFYFDGSREYLSQYALPIAANFTDFIRDKIKISEVE